MVWFECMHFNSLYFSRYSWENGHHTIGIYEYHDGEAKDNMKIRAIFLDRAKTANFQKICDVYDAWMAFNEWNIVASTGGR